MIKADWTIADKDGNITIPDELDGLFNKLGFQLRFHTFSGKNELQTVVDMVWIASEYFKKNHDALLDACRGAKAVMDAQGITAEHPIVGFQYRAIINALKLAE